MRKTRFAPGQVYHIFNRGVEKRTIFLSDSDRWRFLQGLFLFNSENGRADLLWRLERAKGPMNFRILKEFAKEENLERKPLMRIMAYCLMPNHYHLVVEELQEGGTSRFMQKLGVGYTKYFNTRHKRVGSLFQGTFKASLVGNDRYLQYLLVYVNVLNPGQIIEPNLKEEGIKDIDVILDYAEFYPWSTHQEYLGKRASIIIDKGILGEMFPDSKGYLELVRSVLLEKRYQDIQHLTFE